MQSGFSVVLVADLHGRAARLRELPRADLFLAAGDISNFGPVEAVLRALEIAAARYPRVRAVLGNCDPPAAAPELGSRGWDLHLHPSRIGPCLFFGIAGSNPTPAFTPYEWEEPACLAEAGPAVEAAAGQDDGPAGACRVLVSHAPPLGSGADQVGSGRHVGSRAVADIARRLGAGLVLCGHIHEARGVFRWEERWVVNPGPFRHGYFARITVPAAGREGPEIRLERLD